MGNCMILRRGTKITDCTNGHSYDSSSCSCKNCKTIIHHAGTPIYSEIETAEHTVTIHCVVCGANVYYDNAEAHSYTLADNKYKCDCGHECDHSNMPSTANECSTCGHKCKNDMQYYRDDPKPSQSVYKDEYHSSDYYCLICRHYVGTEVNSEKHTYDDNGTCTACGHPCTHSSTLNDGSCEYCGYLYVECSHSSTSEQTVVESTCTAWGSVDVICDDCGTCINTLPVEPTGHSEYTTITEPTCTSNGRIDYHCHNCSYHDDETIPATGHEWTDGDYLNGVYTTVCANCGIPRGTE